jgi:uncharacterized membrane protein YdjX (TVP38/TMEM64 family)
MSWTPAAHLIPARAKPPGVFAGKLVFGRRPKRRTLFKMALALSSLAGLIAYRGPILELLTLVGDREGLLAYLGAFGSAGLAFIYVILTIQVIVAAIPGHVIMLVSGYLYGFLPALIVTHVSTVLASQFAYGLARRYGRPVVHRLAPAELTDKWTRKAEKQGMVFFFFSFILPIFPSDVMNFVAGLSGLSSRKFLFANFVGRLPTSLLFSLVGAQGFRVTPPLLAAAALYTLAMLLAWRYLSPYLEKQA